MLMLSLRPIESHDSGGMKYYIGVQGGSALTRKREASLQELPPHLLDKYAVLAGLGEPGKGLLSKSAVRVRNAVLG